MNDEYGNDVKLLIYNGYIQNVIAGLPQWTFASIIWYTLSSIFGIYAASLWSTDCDELDTFPAKKEILEEHTQRSPKMHHSSEFIE